MILYIIVFAWIGLITYLAEKEEKINNLNNRNNEIH